MLNKNSLLMGSAKEQRKVKLNIGRDVLAYVWGYSKDEPFGSLDVLPYWGAIDVIIYSFSFNVEFKKTDFYLTDDSVNVTAYVEGYTQSISSSNTQDGDTYSMNNSEGAIRYLTFDPPPDGYLDPNTLKPI